MQIPHDAGTEKKVSRALLRDYFAPLKVCIAIIFPALDAHQFSVAPRQFLGKLQGIETHRLQLMNGQIGAATAVGTLKTYVLVPPARLRLSLCGSLGKVGYRLQLMHQRNFKRKSRSNLNHRFEPDAPAHQLDQ
jgi:hypothetical protein